MGQYWLEDVIIIEKQIQPRNYLTGLCTRDGDRSITVSLQLCCYCTVSAITVSLQLCCYCTVSAITMSLQLCCYCTVSAITMSLQLQPGPFQFSQVTPTHNFISTLLELGLRYHRAELLKYLNTTCAMVHMSIHSSTQAAQAYKTFLGLSTHFVIAALPLNFKVLPVFNRMFLPLNSNILPAEYQTLYAYVPTKLHLNLLN